MRQRNVQFNIRLTEAEMETLERDAAALGRSKSEHESMSEQQRQELDRLSGRIWDFIDRLEDIYFPYFKEKK